ncbi:hepatic sodium/bile acid cotransporter [Musca domestica]|uniref:Sodium/bile acid cotransporter n=1 Tax=Musca domestica TaxID=7370 RepID=A0A1I8M837_MUSDO|nr:hepatic sodium/bile acid cotransporter [Musca domestica]
MKVIRSKIYGAIEWLLVILLFVHQSGKVLSDDYGNIAGQWKVQYGGQNDSVETLDLWTSRRDVLPLTIYDVAGTADNQDSYFEIYVENEKLAKVQEEKLITIRDFPSPDKWQGEFAVNGLHFGYTRLYVKLVDPVTSRSEHSIQSLEVVVRRTKRVADNTLTYTAAAIALLMFINLGTVLDLQRLVNIFSRPIGPLLGVCCRYIIMPGLALGLGALMFKDNKPLQLAAFFTAITPSGGIANICNIFLRGNVNLSLATTTVNSILALGMLPLWVFLMGPVLYPEHKFDLPFIDLGVGCVGLCLALVVGVMLRMCIPKTIRFIFRFLKPLSIVLSLCLVALTVGLNYYIFGEITLLIFLLALCLPLLGYILSFILTKLLCRTATDSMTIAIETSVLNMSLPIVLLEYTMSQPMADMLIVVPITSALVSLCLVLIFYIVRRIFGWNRPVDRDCFDEKAFLVEEN